MLLIVSEKSLGEERTQTDHKSSRDQSRSEKTGSSGTRQDILLETCSRTAIQGICSAETSLDVFSTRDSHTDRSVKTSPTNWRNRLLHNPN